MQEIIAASLHGISKEQFNGNTRSQQEDGPAITLSDRFFYQPLPVCPVLYIARTLYLTIVVALFACGASIP